MTPPGSPKSTQATVLEVVVIVAMALALALGIQAVLVKPYRIPSESMEPTLEVHQRVLVDRTRYHLRKPKIGDVVVFHPPAGAQASPNQCGVNKPVDEACPRPTRKRSDVNFIKRIVAGGGDRLRIEDGVPVVNGKRAKESFTMPCGGGDSCNLPRQFTVPPGHFFMMGDNRGASDDSRFWGPVPREWIIGKAFFTYWPPGRLGFL